jgi:hydrogenase maturation protein HypF
MRTQSRTFRRGTPACEHDTIVVHGVVQGVGYRPFVYRLAHALGVRGDVCNSDGRVVINALASPDVLADFTRRLISDAPPHAHPERIERAIGRHGRYDTFRIVESDAVSRNESPVFAIPPDLATCPDCLRELFDSRDRRHRYPFINCTNCGPRYSIVTEFPYDRSRTTMGQFAMCPVCAREYRDPADRRFHAEPISCPNCGPVLSLHDEKGKQLTQDSETSIRLTCKSIRDGGIVAVKGIGGFHLLVDARNDAAVVRLRERKSREAKPLAIMYPSLMAIRMDCLVGDAELKLLESYASPIVLLTRRAASLSSWDIAESVAPSNPLLGVMLPYSPLHHLLLSDLGFPVVATSGNRSEEPICYENDEAFSRLQGIADLFLMHNRPIRRFVDDSIVRIAAGRPLILRRARGYVPKPIAVQTKLPNVLAFGGQQKSTIAVGCGSSAFLSRHIGDLDSPMAASALTRTIADLNNLLHISPKVIICDTHPEYLSTRLAHRTGKTTREVQHHHAHILSVMADNQVDTDVLGIAWDGTGLGDDGTIWGGEFLKVDKGSHSRFASLRQFPLLGGERAIREPRRAALALLHECFGDEFWNLHRLAPVADTTDADRRVITSMLTHGVNSPRTSSMGRFFDGIASILGLRQTAEFEGQAAMELEFAVADVDDDDSYPFAVERADCRRVDWRPMVRAIVANLDRNIPVGRISSRFHSTLAEIALQIAVSAGIRHVALGGGCFQNRVLLERTISRLRDGGFEVSWSRQVPPNDGGLALGQIIAASNPTTECN